MALAGIVQSAYTNSIWGPRTEVATQALVENSNALPWTIVRDRSMNETYVVPGNSDQLDNSTDGGEVVVTTAKPDYLGLDPDQTHSQFRRSLDMLNSLPQSDKFEKTIADWVNKLDTEEREKQRKADKLEAEPDVLQRIDNPTPEDFVAMLNYLPFRCQLLERPLKMVDKIEKATVDQFSRANDVVRFRDINATIKKMMEKLKTECNDAMEERYGTRDVSEATHRYSHLKVNKGSQ